jgi:hypothetical protein
MMRRALECLIVLLASLVLGAASAWWAILHAGKQQAIRNGPWWTSLATGGSDAGMYLRAQIAITGLFALTPSEAVYFTAATDDAGEPLRRRCTYLVEGTPLPARWWSITAYGDDNFLIANAANRFSFNMANLPIAADGTFRVIAGPEEQSGSWLPTGAGAGGFNLTLRVYNPPPELLADLSHVALPSITRQGACA